MIMDVGIAAFHQYQVSVRNNCFPVASFFLKKFGFLFTIFLKHTMYFTKDLDLENKISSLQKQTFFETMLYNTA